VIANFYEFELLDGRIEADIHNAIDAWNSNLYDVTDAIAWQAFKCNLIQEDWVSSIRQSLDELVVVMTYYQGCKNVCIRESTSIISVLESLEDRVNEKRKRIENAEQVIRRNTMIFEHYFGKRNSAIVCFKNEAKEEFSQQRKKRELQVLKSVEDRLSGSGFPGGPKKDDEDDDKLENNLNELQITDNDASHMFADRPGHLIDTPANRKLLIDLASKKENFLGIDSYGTGWYARVVEDGNQLWAAVRRGFVRNGGLNNIHREFHPKTGLCKPSKFFK